MNRASTCLASLGVLLLAHCGTAQLEEVEVVATAPVVAPPAPVDATPKPSSPPTVSAPAPVAKVAEEPPKPPVKVIEDVPGFWTDDELRRIDEGLDVLNVTRKDLGFQKRPIDDPFRLTVVNRILDAPLSIGREAASWDERARTGDPMRLLLGAYSALDCPETPAPRSESIRPIHGSPIAERLGDTSYRQLLGLIAGHDSFGLDDRREDVIAKALLSQVEAPTEKPSQADLSDEEFRSLVQRFDRAKLSKTAYFLLSAVNDLVAQLRAREIQDDPPNTLSEPTPAGTVMLYGSGDDVHDARDDDAVLVIDLGGNDTYTRGASANLLANRPVSVVIDLAGDDRYLGENDFSFGGALGGVAIQWDCAGNDVYVGGNVSCGAGILGVGVLVDEGGNDTYRIKDFGQGAGAFGIGLLLDKAGNDFFHADLYGQGFASTWGCGMLVELGGNDVYDAGGAHLHAPLWRDRFQSLSQGFSIGMRPDASGGVGVLVDVSGNDRYSADIYGQGASYWYSLGLLIDDDGHDTYALGQYGQGSGIHLSAGMLLDRAGQDCYYDANGVGMGGAHDYSVGFLVDRAGDDYYAGGGGAQGGALTNSVAMLIDDAGDDGYAATRDGTQGSATAARNTGGIGLLLDGAGADRYTETTRNDGVWAKDLIGAGIDTPTPADKPSVNAMAAVLSKEDAAKKVETDGRKDGAWELDALWKLVTQWEVGDNTVVMPIAREKFVALGRPALERAFEHVNTKDGLVVRAIEKTLVEFAKTERPAIVERLLAKTKDADKVVRKNSVAMLAALEAKEALPRLTEMLTTDTDTTGTVLSALATLKTAPPEVAQMLKHAKEPVAVQAAVCLGAVGDGDSLEALALALGPAYAFPVRLAAQQQLASRGVAAIDPITTRYMLAWPDDASQMGWRNALRALGGTKSPEAAPRIRAALTRPDRFVRLSAMLAADELLKSLDAPIPVAPPASEADALRSTMLRKELELALEIAHAAETDPFVRRLVQSPTRK